MAFPEISIYVIYGCKSYFLFPRSNSRSLKRKQMETMQSNIMCFTNDSNVHSLHYFGMVLSIGFTYSIEQANTLNRKVGHLTVPLPVLLWFYDNAKSHFTNFYVTLASYIGGSGGRKYAPPIGIAISHVFVILCYITAAKVENQ